MTFLIYTALLVLSVFFSLSQRHLPAVAILGGIITLVGGVVWAVTFLAMAPLKSASFVFTEFVNLSGYASTGWVGIMSFYTPIYALYGTDGILHIAEEMRDAERSAPVSLGAADVAYLSRPLTPLTESYVVVDDFQRYYVPGGRSGYGF